jgi:hypothetical protein
MFEEVIGARSEERAEAFIELRRLLAVHEAAEEEIVHPVARRALADGQSIVERRLREEKEAKAALTELEKLDIDSVDFETKLVALRTNVIAHADSEETEEFNKLGNVLDMSRLARMRKAAELAEAVAPVRPHPSIQPSAANMFGGPFASMLDRARDALSTKH